MKRALASVDRAARFAPSGNGGDEARGRALPSRERIADALRESEDRYRRIVETTYEAELQASHQALAENVEKYRRLFETISDAAFVFEAESRQFVEVNEAALRLYGYTREEFLRLTYAAITAEPEDSEAMIRLTLAGAAPRIPLRYHRRKDGTIFPVELSASTFVLKGRQMACGVVRDITVRKQAEEALRRTVELERQILTISEREQQRLGQDLHDDLCQQLAGIQFLSERLASDLARRLPAQAAQAREIARMMQRAMTQTRDLARGLAPIRLDAEGLGDALRELATRTRRVFQLDCRFRAQTTVLVSDPTVAAHLYRLAQEAVRNAIKHGKARRIQIGLTTKSGKLILSVRDDGLGFASKPPKGEGMGLPIMRYRAEVMGGALTVRSEPGGGTAVLCIVPADACLKT